MNVRSSRRGSIRHGRGWTSHSIGRRSIIDCDDFGGGTEDTVAWRTCKVLRPLHAAVVLALANTITSELETGIEASFELDGSKMTKHTDKFRAFHTDQVADLELAPSTNMFSCTRRSDG